MEERHSVLQRLVEGFFCFLLFFAITGVAFGDILYWEEKAPMPTARSQGMAAVVNGKLYVVGGQTGVGIPPSGILDTVQRYDPASDTWEIMPPLLEARTTSCTAADGNYIYVVGGGSCAGPGCGPPNSDTVIRYDTTDGSSSIIGNINIARHRNNCEVIGNKIYVVGGTTYGGPPGAADGQLDSMEVFDLGSNTVVETVILPGKRDLAATAAVGTKLYIFGGFSGPDLPAESTVWEYDTVAKTFTTKTPMPIARGSRNGFVMSDGKIYLGGGVTTYPPSTTNVNKVLQIYDPTFDTWTIGSGDPAPAEGFGPATGMINDHIYITGGNDNGVVINTTRSSYFQSSVDYQASVTGEGSVTGGGAEVVFPSGTGSGDMVVGVAEAGPSSAPVYGVSQFYDVVTSAEYSGTVGITLPYDNALVLDASRLKLYHWNGFTWEDVTTFVDMVNFTVSGNSISLSPFVAAESRSISSSSGDNGSMNCGSGSIYLGGSILCSITPASGYHLAILIDNTVDVTGSVFNKSYSLANVIADHDIYATFEQNSPVLRISGNGPSYIESWHPGIQSAYDAASSGDEILVMASDFVGNLNVNREVFITLSGGWDTDFQNAAGYSTIVGMMTISNGTVYIEYLIIK